MHVAGQDGKLLLRLGKRFAAQDVERVVEVLEPFMPFSQLVVDFTDVHELQPVGFPALFKLVDSLDGVRVTFRGITEQQARVLRYLGLPVVKCAGTHPSSQTAQ